MGGDPRLVCVRREPLDTEGVMHGSEVPFPLRAQGTDILSASIEEDNRRHL